MPGELTRIFSDIHFGDRASRVHRLEQLRPLLAGVSHLVLNGDTLDTRPSELPAHTARCRAAVAAFFPGHVPRVSFITGNHDTDYSSLHHLDLAGGEVFALHGDIFFDSIVPWSRDAPVVRRRIMDEMRRLPASAHEDLDQRLAVYRRVAMTIPQRHQSEQHGLRYTLRYLADTVWPPHRAFLVMHAWRVMPERAFGLLRRCRPKAHFILTGHLHRPGIWESPDGLTAINTGSFTLPTGAYAVDLQDRRLTVRRILRRAGEYCPGPTLAEFALAGT